MSVHRADQLSYRGKAMYVIRNEVEIALAKVTGGTFELFCHGFFAAVLGDLYVPLGGMHDGGADGVILRRTTQVGQKATHFLQASIEKDTKSKIKSTIKALRKNSREVKQLTYVTSIRVKLPDLIESEILDELGVAVTIRDAEYIAAHINDTTQRQSVFREHMSVYTDYLQKPGSSRLPTASRFMSDPTIFVFLRQEADRENEETFVDSVTDALALWALQGTDPDEQKFMTSDAVREKVLEVLPSVAELVTAERVGRRLVEMSTKPKKERKVRWHRQPNVFALPFETRQVLAEQNADDEALRLRVEEQLDKRAARHCESGLDTGRVSKAALVALQKTFESRGLQFAAFIENGETSPSLPDLDEPTALAVTEANPGPGIQDDFFIATLATVRDCLYQASEDEHEYLRRLARTYAMLFALRQDVKIVDYLQEMNSRFTLYVGSDILVLAMSEKYLEPSNQSATNLLKMSSEAGAKLILTESVVEEVTTHLQAADREFQNRYKNIEGHLPSDLFGEIPRIMIRAYFYNRHTQNGPQNWPHFIGQFCDYGDLHKPIAETGMRLYLQASFGMEYESSDVLDALTDSQQVADLTRRLMESKTKYELARNDAQMVLAVYGKRASQNEGAVATVFGLATWWLTTETRVLKHTRDIVKLHKGARYMMRPDFLLNLFALAPDMAKVRQTYRKLFPAALGLELSRRMDHEYLEELVGQLNAAEELDDARRLSEMSRCSDLAKSDFRRRHLRALDPIGSSTGTA